MPDTNQNRTPERRPAQSQGGARRQESPSQGGGKRQAPRSKTRKRRRPVALTILIRIFQVIGTLLLMGVVTGCFMICFAVVYVRTSVLPKAYLNLDDYTMDENSIIVYVDRDTQELRELQTLKGNENRELVEYDQIPEDLINAFIAIEDKRFWNHQGVDWRGTAAGLSKLFTGGSIRGGSTIDQQLIKNLTGDKDVTVTRKIMEIFKALELENNYQKEVILTTYLNKIYLGNGCDGIQAASRYYFGKNVWELDLAECASLAGITNNPSLYAPRGVVEVMRYTCQECGDYYLNEKPDVCETCGKDSFDDGVLWTNREYNKARQELILNEMAREDEARDNKAYITEAERDAAIAEPLVFAWDRQGGEDGEENGEDTEDSAPSGVYSWYTEAVINEAIEVLQEHTGMSYKTCKDRVFSGGLTIVCAYDPEAQAAVDTVFNNRSNLDQVSSRTGQRLMAAISLVDNSSGLVVAMGSTEDKTVNRGWNTPVDTVRQPGSSIKPLSVYGPAIDMGLITPASVIDDNPYLLNGSVWPLNVSANYRGLTTVQYAVQVSLNTVALRVVEQVTPDASYDFMVNKFGFTSLEAYRETSTGKVLSDIDRSPLSMGGLTDGVSTFEMAAAYATFPRNGEFTKATTVLEIRDANGNVIVDNRPVSSFILKETTAYYINSMLTNVVSSGTGTGARIAGQTVAGKTGTTNDVFDYWFCGYTNYYTAAVWAGYSNSEVINYTHANPTVPLWQKVMSILHEGKENAPFDVPGTLNSYSICLDCGKQANANCTMDIRGNRTQTFRLFAADAPTEQCTCHVPVQICVDSPILDGNGEATGRYHLAGKLCPEETVKTVYMVEYERELAKPGLHIGDENGLLSWYDSIPEDERYCNVHVEGWEEPTPPPTESMDPGVWPSDWPGPGPDVSDQPIIPPTQDPGPVVEPPEPSFEPILPIEPIDPGNGDAPYIPAVDDWGNPISP